MEMYRDYLKEGTISYQDKSDLKEKIFNEEKWWLKINRVFKRRSTVVNLLKKIFLKD